MVTEDSPRITTAPRPLEPLNGETANVDRYRRALEATLGIPFTAGNRITVLRNGCEIFPAMLDAIRQARSSIELLTFVYWTGDIAQKFAKALAKKAQQGLTVQVILDAYGAKQMNHRLVEQMQRAGVEVMWFRPPSWRLWRYDNRTHRKVLICDGQIGFTGGVGIAEEWEGDARNPREWRDTHFRIEGPAVHGIHAAFVGNWAEMGRHVRLSQRDFPRLPRVGDAYAMSLRSVASVGWSDIATLVQSVIELARERLRISTPYFVPDQSTLGLLCNAAKRGVEVEIQVPGPHIDQRIARAAAQAHYRPLLQHGVAIYRYLPTMLHTKCITVDGVLACVGSPNLNHRSLRKDDEFCLTLLHPPTVRILDQHFVEDRARSERVRSGRWNARGALQRLKESAARTLRHQL